MSMYYRPGSFSRIMLFAAMALCHAAALLLPGCYMSGKKNKKESAFRVKLGDVELNKGPVVGMPERLPSEPGMPVATPEPEIPSEPEIPPAPPEPAIPSAPPVKPEKRWSNRRKRWSNRKKRVRSR